MKIGDLVRKLNPWTAHNSWMKFDSDAEPGLVIAVDKSTNGHGGDRMVKVKWMWNNEQEWHVPKFLEKIEKE